MPGITTSDKVLYNKSFDLAENPKYRGYQRGLASVVHKILIESILI